MQVATIEFARHVAGMKDANSTEFAPGVAYPVVSLLEEQKQVRQKGATMRCGSFPCHLQSDSTAHKAYGLDVVHERHRHRYEFNNDFIDELTRAGLIIGGTSPNRQLVELIEVRDHPWFVGCQFHPEFQSKALQAHPLFSSFVGTAAELCMSDKT